MFIRKTHKISRNAPLKCWHFLIHCRVPVWLFKDAFSKKRTDFSLYLQKLLAHLYWWKKSNQFKFYIFTIRIIWVVPLYTSVYFYLNTFQWIHALFTPHIHLSATIIAFSADFTYKCKNESYHSIYQTLKEAVKI